MWREVHVRTPLVIDLVIVLILDKMKTLFLLFISLLNISFILSSNTPEESETVQGKDKSEKTTLGPELNESSTGSKIDEFMGEDSDSFDDPFANHEDFIGDNSTTTTTTTINDCNNSYPNGDNNNDQNDRPHTFNIKIRINFDVK